MADDDDYMSDKFIVNAETFTSPGLVLKPCEKRAIKLTKRKIITDMKSMKKTKCNMEEEQRDKGLLSVISNDNKGYEMLMKMGYKPGQGIGKHESGVSEPIPVTVKSNRSGFGTINKKPKKSLQLKNDNAIKLNDNMASEFRDRIASRKMEQLMDVDLLKCQKVCEQLDIKHNINEPLELWYWPIVSEVKEHDDDNDDKNINKYVTNDDDNIDNKLSKISEEVNNDIDDDKELVELSTEIKLRNITEYLRKQYAYCIWCGVSYDDENDLYENCPGNSRNDH